MTLQEIGLEILYALSPVVVALLIALITYGMALVRKKIAEIDNDMARRALDGALVEAELVATDAIKATNQVFVDAVKERAEDGKLTKEEAQEAMRLAKEYFLGHITSHSKSILEAAIGPINEWLEGFLEAKLAQQKGSVAAQVNKIVNPT